MVTGKRLVVPFTYDPAEAVSLANKILQGNLDRVTRSGELGEMSGYHGVLADMYNSAQAGGPIDLQRNYNGNTGSEDFVEDFTPAASYNYGIFGAAMGLPSAIVQIGGGFYNIKQRLKNPDVDVGWMFGNNPKNIDYILAGFNGFASKKGLPIAPKCFLAGTPILMANSTEKPIELVRPGDLVMSVDASLDGGRGALVLHPVKCTFQNETQQMVDLRGLRRTPGHVFLTGETDHQGHGVFKTIARILKEDGTLVDKNGTVRRARTGSAIGSVEDVPVQVSFRDPDSGSERLAFVRAGVPAITGHLRPAVGKTESRVWSLAQWSAKQDIDVLLDGMLRTRDGEIFGASDWPFGSTPFDAQETQNWVVATQDGRPYTPPWIMELVEEDEDARLRVVGEMVPSVVGVGGVRSSPGEGTPAVNRAQRRRLAALARL